MIPTRYIEELKNSPDEDADFSGSFLEVSCKPHDDELLQPLTFEDVYGSIYDHWFEVASAS